MSRHWWTDPNGNGTVWQGPYEEGAFVTLPDGTGPVKVTHQPAIGLYLAVEDSRRKGLYEVQLAPRWLVSLQGTLGDQAARALETLNTRPMTLDETRIRKQQELDQHVVATRYTNCQTNLTPNWVIRIEEEDRAWFAEVNGVLQDRMRDRVYDSDPKAYWPRDVPVRAINVNTNRYITQDVTETQWGTIMKDVGLHGYAIVDASALVQADIDAAVAADDQAALAAIDVQSPSYGWPPVYSPEIAPTKV